MEFFKFSCQSLTYPFPFFRKVKENKKKRTRFTQKQGWPGISAIWFIKIVPTNLKKWLHEIIQLLKIFKILAVSLCQRCQKRTRFEAIWHEFSNPQFSDPRPPSGRPRDRTQYFSWGSAAKKGLGFFRFLLLGLVLKQSGLNFQAHPVTLYGIKLVQNGSNLSEMHQTWSNLSKLDQTGPKWIKHVQNGSNLSKKDQNSLTGSNSYKFDHLWLGSFFAFLLSYINNNDRAPK